MIGTRQFEIGVNNLIVYDLCAVRMYLLFYLKIKNIPETNFCDDLLIT